MQPWFNNLDESIGLLLEAYDTMGLMENTYLIFTSDNGGMPTLPIQVNERRTLLGGAKFASAAR